MALKGSHLEERRGPMLTINDDGGDHEDGYQLRLPTEGAHHRQQRLSKMQRLVQVAHLNRRPSTQVKLPSQETTLTDPTNIANNDEAPSSSEEEDSPDYRLLFSFATFKDLVLEVARLQTKNRQLREQVRGVRARQEEGERVYREVAARVEQ
jgi:hypothetical protein